MSDQAPKFDHARKFILGTVGDLDRDDFAFSVDAVGTPWDVYRFRRHGRRGMLAVRLVDGLPEVGFFAPGEYTKEEVARQIAEDAPN